MSAYAAYFLGCPCPSEQVKGELEREQGRERDGEWNIFDVERFVSSLWIKWILRKAAWPELTFWYFNQNGPGGGS